MGADAGGQPLSPLPPTPSVLRGTRWGSVPGCCLPAWGSAAPPHPGMCQAVTVVTPGWERRHSDAQSRLTGDSAEAGWLRGKGTGPRASSPAPGVPGGLGPSPAPAGCRPAAGAPVRETGEPTRTVSVLGQCQPCPLPQDVWHSPQTPAYAEGRSLGFSGFEHVAPQGPAGHPGRRRGTRSKKLEGEDQVGHQGGWGVSPGRQHWAFCGSRD